MLDAYIKVMGGLAKWLLFIILEFIGPAVRIIGGFMSVGGLLAFIICLFLWGVSETPQPDIKTVAFVMLGTGILGAALLVFYEILVGRMFLERIDDENDEGEGIFWWNWLGVVMLLAGASVASYYFHHLRNGIEALAVGFGWFLVTGIFIGVARWFYRMGGNAVSVVGIACLARIRMVIAGKGKEPPHDGRDDVRVVVPFRRR